MLISQSNLTKKSRRFDEFSIP